MAGEQEGLTTRELDEATDIKPGHFIVISDTSIPADDPGAKSFKISPENLRGKIRLWTPPAALNTILNLSDGDYLVVSGLSQPLVHGQRVIKNGDQFRVHSKNENLLLPMPKNALDKALIGIVDHAASPFTASVNSKLFVDVSDGPVRIILPVAVTPADYIEIYPLGGQYSLNNLILEGEVAIAGEAFDEGDPDANKVTVDIDNLFINAQFLNTDYGYVLTS